MNLKLTPTNLKGCITPPPSKSQAHRLIIAAALAVGMLFQLFRPYKESGRLTQTVKIK